MPDWCTLWPDGSWGHCCALHDIAYTLASPKLEADLALARCVAGEAGLHMAAVMLAGVSLFGMIFYNRKGRRDAWKKF